MSQQGYIQVWNDRDLVPGEQWEAGITDALQRADIVLLFYTTAARISDFIQQTEPPTALDRSDAKQCAQAGHGGGQAGGEDAGAHPTGRWGGSMARSLCSRLAMTNWREPSKPGGPRYRASHF